MVLSIWLKCHDDTMIVGEEVIKRNRVIAEKMKKLIAEAEKKKIHLHSIQLEFPEAITASALRRISDYLKHYAEHPTRSEKLNKWDRDFFHMMNMNLLVDVARAARYLKIDRLQKLSLEKLRENPETAKFVEDVINEKFDTTDASTDPTDACNGNVEFKAKPTVKKHPTTISSASSTSSTSSASSRASSPGSNPSGSTNTTDASADELNCREAPKSPEGLPLLD